MFSQLKSIKKFTTKSEIDNLIGKPEFQIENRLVFYYGNGIFVAYTSRCFKVEGIQRIEFGEEGIYAVCFYHFCDVEMLKSHLRIDFFDDDATLKLCQDMIDNNITYDMSFKAVHNMKLNNIFDNYSEGETHVLIHDKLEIQNLFIMYGQYTLFFRGKSKTSKLSGFQYTFFEPESC